MQHCRSNKGKKRLNIPTNKFIILKLFYLAPSKFLMFQKKYYSYPELTALAFVYLVNWVESGFSARKHIQVILRRKNIKLEKVKMVHLLVKMYRQLSPLRAAVPHCPAAAYILKIGQKKVQWLYSYPETTLGCISAMIRIINTVVFLGQFRIRKIIQLRLNTWLLLVTVCRKGLV